MPSRRYASLTQFDPDAYILFYRKNLEDHDQTTQRAELHLMTPHGETADHSEKVSVKVKTVATNLIQRRNFSNSFKDGFESGLDPLSRDRAKTLAEERQTSGDHADMDRDSTPRDSQTGGFSQLLNPAPADPSPKQRAAP